MTGSADTAPRATRVVVSGDLTYELDLAHGALRSGHDESGASRPALHRGGAALLADLVT